MEKLEENIPQTADKKKKIGILAKVLIILASFFTFIILAIFLLCFGLQSPAFLTPIVNKTLSQHIKGEARIDTLDLKFISSFPVVDLRITGISLKSESEESIADIKRIELSFNPLAIVRKKKIKLRHLLIDEPRLNLLSYEDGTSNLNILKTPPQTVAADSLSEGFDLQAFVEEIEVDSIKIRNADLWMENRQSKSHVSLSRASLFFALYAKGGESHFLFNTQCDTLDYMSKGRKLLNRVPLKFESDFRINRNTKTLSIERGDLEFRNLGLQSSGTLVWSKEQGGIIFDVACDLGLHSLKGLIDALPERILSQTAAFNASGEAQLGAKIKGLYSKDRIPDVEAVFEIADGSFKFDTMKYGVQKLDVLSHLWIDGADLSKTKIIVEKGDLLSDAGLDVDFSSTILDPMGRCDVDFALQADLDIDRVAQVVPIPKWLSLKGSNYTDMTGRFSRSDFEVDNYGAMRIGGKSEFKAFEVLVDGTKMADTTRRDAYLLVKMNEGHFDFGSEKATLSQLKDDAVLKANVNFSGVQFRDKNGIEVSVDDVALQAQSNMKTDSAIITPMSGELTLGRMRLNIPDTLTSQIGRSTLRFTQRPAKRDSTVAFTNLTLETDSLGMIIPMTRMRSRLEKGRLSLTLFPTRDSLSQYKRDLAGSLAFDDLRFRSDYFPLPLEMPSSKLTFRRGRFALEDALLKVGKSDFTLTGWVDKILGRLLLARRDQLVSSSLTVDSKFIDIAELYEASTEAQRRMQAESDSLALISKNGITQIQDPKPSTQTQNLSEQVGEPSTTQNQAKTEFEPSTKGAASTSTGEIVAQDSTNNSSESEFLQAASVDKTSTPTPSSSTDSLSVIRLPRGIESAMNLNVERLAFDSLSIYNVRGGLGLRREQLFLDSLNFECVGSQMSLTGKYKPESDSLALAQLHFSAADVVMEDLIDVIPTFTSIVPASRSVRGKVNFDMVAISEINEQMMPDLLTLQSAMSLDGVQLSLLDGETFASVAKMLKFKQRERNIIDSLNMHIVTKKGGNIQIPPFELTMDRYRFIIGGKQVLYPESFDTSYDYNVSIMKSPLPFRAGVDISGFNEDLEYKITKAKLKKSDFETIDFVVAKYRENLLKLIEEDVESMSKPPAAAE